MHKNNIKALLVAIVWMIIALIIREYMQYSISESVHNILTILNLFGYLLCMYSWIACGNRAISIYNLFILYALLSNLGQSILFLCSVHWTLLSVYINSTIAEVNYMLAFQLLCIAALNLGATTYNYKRKNCISIQEQVAHYSKARPSMYNAKVEPILMGLLFISLAYILMMALKMLLLRQSVDYGDLYAIKAGWGGFYGQIIGVLSLVLCLRFIFRKRYIKIIYSWLVTLICIYMVVGTRSLMLPYLSILVITLPVTYPQFFKKKYIPVWIGLFIIGFTLLGVVSAYRQSSIDAASLSTGNSFWDYFIDTISEMGMSTRTSLLTIEAINNGFPTHQTILNTIINAFVPFVSNVEWIKAEYISCSTWVTDYAQSYHSGLGYCFIAEAYMNYGKYGWIILLAYGWFLAYGENTAYRRIMQGKYLYALILLVILSRQVFFARGQFDLIGGTIRISIYLSIIWFMIKRIR